MTASRIFLAGSNEESYTLVEETAFETEDELQALLARCPYLMAGDQIDPDEPRRWLLVDREVGIPGEVGGPSRWSLDHLFLDQDGIPTLVECKLASDPRSRYDVTTQMITYASNGPDHWDISVLRQLAANSAARNHNRLLDDEIRALLRDDAADIEGFWRTVADNLKRGKVRLVFVADRIPSELSRSSGFLKKPDVEVLAIEIKQFKGKDQRAFVPRVVVGPKSIIRERFLDACPPATRPTFEMVLDHSIARGYTIYWGKLGFSVRAHLSKEQRRISFAYGWPSGNFQIYLRDLPISDTENKALREKLTAYGIFRDAGKWTLDAKLDARAIAIMPRVYEFLLEEMDKIAKEH